MTASKQGAADLVLVRDVLAGDRSAEDRFVGRMLCVSRILADRNRRTGAPLGEDDLRDLVQDVLSLVWQKLDTYLGEASLETWVWHFCVLSFLNRVRRVRKSSGMVGVVDAASVADRESSAERLDPQDVDTVHVALDRLPAAEAAAIRAKQFGEKTFEEIATETGESVNTVKSRYYRGLERMRSELAVRFDGRDG